MPVDLHGNSHPAAQVLRGPRRAFSGIGSWGVREEILRAPEGGFLRGRVTGGARATVKGRGVWQSEEHPFKTPGSLAHGLGVWQMAD